MSVESNARDHVARFRWHVGDLSMSLREAELRDLAALRDAVGVVIAVHVRELVQFEAMSWSAVASSLSPAPAVLQRLYGR